MSHEPRITHPGEGRRAPTCYTGSAPAAEIDVDALERDLAAAVEGEVRFDTAVARHLRHRRVELPPAPDRRRRSRARVDDIVATHGSAASHDAPILARGCGTSLSGRVGQLRGGHRLLEVPARDPARSTPSARTVRVQPGAINEQSTERTGPSTA